MLEIFSDCNKVKATYESIVKAELEYRGQTLTTDDCMWDAYNAVVNVAVRYIFYSFVFGFGSKFKIKEPKLVREEYKQMVRNTAELLSTFTTNSKDQEFQNPYLEHK